MRSSAEPLDLPAEVGERDLLLEVENVSYAYLDRFAALDDVSLAIRPGERVALLGANGSGKSTLLKLLDGLVFPTSGSFRAFGVDVSEANLEDEQFARAFRSRIGFVFQNSDAQVFSPTVREEVAFGPLNMGLSVDQVSHRVDDVLVMLDITALAERAPFQLSGGQKKRVAIASVLVMNPDVLIFDEPTAGLDPRTQAWLLDLIVELNAAGKTIIVATHDLASLEQLATRCIVFGENHRIVADGTPREVLADRRMLHDANLVHEHTHVHMVDAADGLQLGIVHAHEHDESHHAVDVIAPDGKAAR